MAKLRLGFGAKISKASKDEFVEKIIAEIKKKLLSKRQKLKDIIKGAFRRSLPKIFFSSKESSKLFDPYVFGSLGVPDLSQRLDLILDIIGKNINVEISLADFNLLRIDIGIIRASYDDILAVGASYFVTENNQRLEWLDWLLNAGDYPVVIGYDFIYSKGVGRVKLGYMAQKRRSYQVPAEVAGIGGDNFLTRAFIEKEDEINDLITDAVKAVLNG